MITDASILEIIRTQGQVISAHFQAFLEVIDTENKVISICFQAASLLISLCTLRLAVKAFKRYVSDKVSEKQLDEVIDLLKKLENLTFLIGVRDVREFGPETFFEREPNAESDLNVFSAIPEGYKLNKEVDVLFSREAIPIFSAIYGLSKNVLLPLSIAEPLRKFSHFEWLNLHCEKGKGLLTPDDRPPLETIQKLEEQKLIEYPFLYISSSIKRDGNEWIQIPEYYCVIPSRYDLYRTTGFFKALNDISKSILKWLEKSNIKDLNIKRHSSKEYISILKRAEIHKSNNDDP